MNTRINPRLDTNLVKIMKRHCKCEHVFERDFISEAIAEKLNVPLDENHRLSEDDYAEYQILEIDNCIDKLEKKKRELEKLMVTN